MRYATLFLSLLPLACDPEPPAVQRQVPPPPPTPPVQVILDPPPGPGVIHAYRVANGVIISDIYVNPADPNDDIAAWLRRNPGWFTIRGPRPFRLAGP